MIFVGNDAFPKGFVPAFEAIEKLVRNGAKIKLTVIGGFKKTGYLLKEFSPEEGFWLRKVKETLWINYHEKLQNHEVIDKMAKSHLLIYPSYDESLGWAVVEAGLLGVPSITTNIFALKELVLHQVSGFVIELNLGKQTRWQGVWSKGVEFEQELDQANKVITEGVTTALLSVFSDPSILEKWGEAVKKKMKNMYEVEQASKDLALIYKEALESPWDY